jgi:hypothetical protein
VPVVWVQQDRRTVNVLARMSSDGSNLAVRHGMVSETLARSRELTAEAVVLRARAQALVAEARWKIQDHRYLLTWALPSWELASERSSHSRLDDAVIRDFARYGGFQRRPREWKTPVLAF